MKTRQAWDYSTATGRWAGFGPYYAMFPVSFAKQVIETMCPVDGRVLDPFCGRGTAPFVAQATGRRALGIDANPVAWVFAKSKISPEPDMDALKRRLLSVRKAVRRRDKQSKNEFQKWAWSPDVLGFLNAGRRILQWRTDRTDRTLMGFVLAHAHAKLGDGVSNQMHKARALGPDYSVRWWKNRGMSPPNIDPVEYLERRIDWRYRHGVVESPARSEIALASAENSLPQRQRGGRFDLMFTSPPYFSVTNYRHDSWIRLWLLNQGPALPDWKTDPRVSRQTEYKKMLHCVFLHSKRLLKPAGAIWVRTDSRVFTKKATECALRANWPRRKLYMREDSPERTQTAHFGNTMKKSGEIDFLIPGGRKPPEGFLFVPVTAAS